MVINKYILNNKLKNTLISSLDYDKSVNFTSSSYVLLNIDFINKKQWNFATTYESQLLDLNFEYDGVEIKDATNLFKALTLFNINSICILECKKLFENKEDIELTCFNHLDLQTIQNIKYIENGYGYDDYILIFDFSISFLILIPPLVDKIFIAGHKNFVQIACADEGWVLNEIIN